ncbi:MAG: immunoglobulin domain-containing protein [Candidatus Kapabacteria bacterium]|nr:immunoglobulin domain-containing protein [Candidatus Kapabacteria bacterium]
MNLRRQFSLLCAVLLALVATYQANAQLTAASCNPSGWYGRMCLNNFTFNSTVWNNTSCSTTFPGTTNATSQAWSVAPGQTCTWSSTQIGLWSGIYNYSQFVYIYVDFNNNGVLNEAGEQVYGPVGFYSGGGDGSSVAISGSGSFVVPANVAAGPKRMRVFTNWTAYGSLSGQPCGFGGYGDCIDFTLNVGFNNDAGVSMVSTQTAPPFAPGNNTITATLRNYGLNTLTSAMINWSVNGVTQQPVSWTGSVTAGQTTTVNLLPYSFPAVGALTVQAWTSTPNGVTDPNAANDISPIVTLGAALNGTYTVGGSSPNFTTLQQATDQLRAGGTLGAVTLNLRPGTYTGYIYIANPIGNQSARPITIQADASASGSRDNVFIQHDGGATQSAAINATSIFGGQPTVRLQNVDFITFNNVTIAATGTGAANWAQCVELMGNTTAAGDGCDNVTFSNCGFTGRVATGFFNNDLLFFSQAAAHQNLVVSGCTFTNGASGIFIWRSVTPFVTGMQITNNTFNNFVANGMTVNVTDGLVMTGNTLRTTSSLLNTGINIANNIGTFVMSKNRVLLNNTGTTTIPAILLQARTNTNPGRPMVSNNFIRVNGNTWGVRTSGSSNTDFVHNTVYSTSSTTPVFSNEGGSNGYAIVNNVIYNAGGGQVANNVSGSTVSVMNYNNLFTTGGTLGTWNGTGTANLAGWRSASAQDMNSSSTAVTFNNVASDNFNLTMVDANLYGMGSSSNGTFTIGATYRAMDDFYGTSRNRSEVYMGAHQIVPVITFNPPPPATIEGCQNQNFTMSANAQATFGAQLTFSWQRNGSPLIEGVNGVTGSSTNAISITNTQPSLHGGDYVLRVTATGGADPLVSNTINVVINAPIEINRQPQSRILCLNNETALNVVASGTILGYQWQKDGVPIVGATNPLYVISNASYNMSGRYRCVMSGTCGTTTVLSDDAVIYVANNTLVGRDPGTRGAAVGSTGYLDVEVSATAQVPGYSPQFQWYKNGTALTDNGRITGATTSQLTIRNMTAGDISNDYTCMVTGICGSQTSQPGGFYISSVAIQSQPRDASPCSGTDAVLSVQASSNIPGATYSYQWYKGTTLVSNSTKYGGATTNVLTIRGAVSGDEGDYRVVVTANPGGANISSDIAKLVVNAAPVVSTQPANVTVCEGQPATMDVASSGSGLSYQWMLNGVMVPGATDARVTVAQTMAAMNGAKVTVKVTNGCGEVVSNEATLTVNLKPVVTVQPTAPVIAIGGTFTLSVTATGAVSYQWKKDGTALPGGTMSTYEIRNASRSDEGSYTVEVTNSCGTVVSDGVLIRTAGNNDEAIAAGYKMSEAYPMPVNGVATVNITLPDAGTVRVIVTDMFGREVGEVYNGVAGVGVTPVVLNTSGLSAGVYNVTMTSGKYGITKQLVVVN